MDGNNEDEVEVLPADEPPKGGKFADWDGAQVDPDMVMQGNEMGLSIDPDDDGDNGLDKPDEESEQ